MLKVLLVTPFFLASVVDAAAFYTPPCVGEPCTQTFSEHCSRVLARFDFQGDCCSLADDPKGEGCILTVSNGECQQNSRPGFHCSSDHFQIDDSDPFALGCVPGTYMSLTSENSTTKCPASVYKVRQPSSSELLQPLIMTLEGVSVWDETAKEQWRQIFLAHVEQFFANQDLGVSDLMTDVDLYFAKVIDKAQSHTLLYYYQILSWRSPTGVDSEFIAEAPFTTTQGVDDFVESLRANGGVFLDITGITFHTQKSHHFEGLSMTLSNVGTMSELDITNFENEAMSHTTDYFQSSRSIVAVKANITVINREEILDISGRRLEETVTFSYDEEITYRTTDEMTNPKFVATQPFETTASAAFVEKLQESGGALATVNAASSVDVPYNPTATPSGPSTGDMPTCSICGPNRVVSNEEGEITDEEGNSIGTCSDLQAQGENGFIEAGMCERLPDQIGAFCKCNKSSAAQRKVAACIFWTGLISVIGLVWM